VTRFATNVPFLAIAARDLAATKIYTRTPVRTADPVPRKKVEDAAQDWLMKHFRERKWRVRDVRFGNPYDAIATKDGRTLWLEAKGTETSGSTVIVSRGEVKWARDHPGDCVLGILSDVVFRPDGEVDPASGNVPGLHVEPGHRRLSPRDYDFTPADSDRSL
jgi:hypothetical protein